MLPSPCVRARREPLTPREREVLLCLTLGLNDRQIGERFCRSRHTVSNHMRAILRKLGAQTRAQAVFTAWACGLLEPARDANVPRSAAPWSP